MGPVIVCYIWKWTPFWTVIFFAGRMAIPRELYEAADVDGATGIGRFVYVTFPLLANLYLVCTLLSTIWALGDFNIVHFVSGGGPALTTHGWQHSASGTRSNSAIHAWGCRWRYPPFRC